jgi:bifunctional non-homologous end joining protein LigD
MSWRDDLSEDERDALKKESVPDWTAPMLATLTHDYFSDADWIYERKLDGERCLVFRDGDDLRILSRNQKNLNDTYPELVEALERERLQRFVVDGEIVAFEGDVTSFSRLQGRIGIKDPDEARASGIAVYLYLFDILHLDGHDVTGLPLRTRKALLKKALSFKDPVRYTAHRNEEGEKYHEEACGKGWEGVIAKDAGSTYAHSRSRKWLKFKCGNRQELVVGGFTEPGGSRIGFGALLLGYYEDGELRYAGKVGTGFDDETLESLRERMDGLERETCPFADCDEPSGKGVHWITPKLVAEIGFTEWTGDDRLRHPRYLGLRTDKPAKKVVRERPQEAG